ncbi:histone-like nucleoid-structuring protein Lsr2 [Streptomyces sp. NPDC008121]|uniref:histone-like nucleoid-structuring protein Lsr2 n=1 Tax=Streptomyces sp. NPDC008121 TaxID=3364809 RepID=UPI0036F107C2
MAKRVVTLFTDDITGSEEEDVTNHRFSIDGIMYEIDLGHDSYQQLLDALGPFIRSGRKTSSSPRGSARKRSAPDGRLDAGRVRAWAQEQGIEVSARGRIPKELQEKYEAVH